MSTDAGFEPTRASPSRFQVCHLNHSVNLSTTYLLQTSLSSFKQDYCTYGKGIQLLLKYHYLNIHN